MNNGQDEEGTGHTLPPIFFQTGLTPFIWLRISNAKADNFVRARSQGH